MTSTRRSGFEGPARERRTLVACFPAVPETISVPGAGCFRRRRVCSVVLGSPSGAILSNGFFVETPRLGTVELVAAVVECGQRGPGAPLFFEVKLLAWRITIAANCCRTLAGIAYTNFKAWFIRLHMHVNKSAFM